MKTPTTLLLLTAVLVAAAPPRDLPSPREELSRPSPTGTTAAPAAGTTASWRTTSATPAPTAVPHVSCCCCHRLTHLPSANSRREGGMVCPMDGEIACGAHDAVACRDVMCLM